MLCEKIEWNQFDEADGTRRAGARAQQESQATQIEDLSLSFWGHGGKGTGPHLEGRIYLYTDVYGFFCIFVIDW